MKKTKNRSILALPHLFPLNNNNNKESFISSKPHNLPTIPSLPINNKRLRQFFLRSRNINNDYDNILFDNKTSNSILSTSRGASTKRSILKIKTLRKIPLSKIYSRTLNTDNTIESHRKGKSLSLTTKHNNNNNNNTSKLNITQKNYNKPFKRNAQRKTILKSLDMKYEQLNKEFDNIEAQTMKIVEKSFMMNLKESQRFKKIHNNINPYYALNSYSYSKQLQNIHKRVQSLKDL